MKRETLVIIIIGFLLGILVTVTLIISAINSKNESLMKLMGVKIPQSINEDTYFDLKDEMMDSMAHELVGKSGDEFDKAFLEQMIIHHEGAIEMADLAQEMAKHQEIKKMAEDIISTQTKEIEQMENWKKEWGYKETLKAQLER
jgi:uncharacterized protein (DUF305 family)